MDKRQFLTATALAGVSIPALAAPKAGTGPALLTVTGALAKTNRGPFDPALDLMMAKHKIGFTKAYTFDFAALASLPALTIKPTLETDAKVHTLRGPALLDVVRAAGAPLNDASRVVLRAVDGYAATITVAQARAQRLIVATHLDGEPMALGGVGPLWALMDADRIPELAAKPLAQRFAGCPWALYHVEVQA